MLTTERNPIQFALTLTPLLYSKLCSNFHFIPTKTLKTGGNRTEMNIFIQTDHTNVKCFTLYVFPKVVYTLTYNSILTQISWFICKPE